VVRLRHSHLTKATSLPVKARFGLGLSPITSGGVSYVLGNPDGVASTVPTGPGYYELTYSSHTGRWRLGVQIGPSGGTLDLDELRVWEYLDIEPYLEELIPAESATEVFQMPFGKYFAGTHYRWSSKRMVVSLLVPYGETNFRKQLEALMAPLGLTGRAHPLELFVDNYLFRCAPNGLRKEWVSGMVLRYILDLQLLLPFGYHQNRSIVRTFGTSLPFGLTVNNPGTTETPCEVRVSIPNTAVPARFSIFVSGTATFADIKPTYSSYEVVYSIQESGRVLVANRSSSGTTVVDKTSNLQPSSRVPLLLAPGDNVIVLRFFDSNDNEITTPGGTITLSCTFNPRVGEVVLP